MQPLLYLSCADDARRSAITAALERNGLELTPTLDELVAVYILDDSEGLLIRDDEETLLQLSVSPPPDDIPGLVRLALELTGLWDTVRAFEDAESAGVIAANIAQEARDALLPVLFAADALAQRCPGDADLVDLLVGGCDRVMKILLRVAPVSRRGTPLPTCANSVVSGLVESMRAIAQHAKLVTRLETPLPPAAIERADLERMLLNLIANAGGAERIVVATSSRVVKRVEADLAPTGDWIVVEVEHDGATIADEVRERALTPILTLQPMVSSSGLGLPSIARVTRSAGGHIAIDNKRLGTKVEIWLPRADAASDVVTS